MKALFQGITRFFTQKYQRRIIAKRGVWFVDIPRTSSTSIRNEIGKKYGLVFEKNKNKLSIPPHKTAREIKTFLGNRIWKRLFTFSIVRNPWDKTLSYFLWAKSKGYLEKYNFKEFVFELRKQFNTGKTNLRRHAYAGCVEYIYDYNGELLVDFVVKFENRLEDLDLLRTEINSRQRSSRFQFSKAELGYLKINESNKKLFNEYFDIELINIIKEIYKDDIETFGFETPNLNSSGLDKVQN